MWLNDFGKRSRRDLTCAGGGWISLWHTGCLSDAEYFPLTNMNIKHNHTPLPDVATVTPELTMSDHWDAEAVSRLVRSKSDHGETPAFLFLGRKEARLLQQYLADVFGAESVTTLKDTYYMGLDVVVVDCESFIFAGGRKAIRTLQDPISRRPAWRERESEARWQLRM